MFVTIEAPSAEKRKKTAENERLDTANKLWEISCCDLNVFNKTVYEEA
jgi:hypothetical protein